MANGHGGPRDGAGRKRTRDKYESEVNAAERKIADKLPRVIGNLFKLANGGYKREEEKYERIVKRDAVGNPILKDGQLQYEFVLVEKKISVAEPDRTANIALLERILGKPASSMNIEDEDGETVPFAIVRIPSKVTPEEWQQQAKDHASKASSSQTGSSQANSATTEADASKS